MYWYDETGKESDVVVSSRIRFARNITDKPFMSRLNKEGANDIIRQVRDALDKDGNWSYTDFEKLPDEEAQSFVERYDVSPEFIESKLPHGYLRNENTGVGIMICEEDHIRLQCIRAGLALEEAFESARQVDDVLCEKLDIAFDEKLGFLTHCPTNLGTAMRASVMVFLPALSMNHRIGALSTSLGKLGLTIRGMWGEGSDSDGYMYQISNQTTLGIGEEDTIKKLEEITSQIMELERGARNAMKSDNPERMTDLAYRSLGTLRSSYLMSSKEFLSLFAYVRLGLSLGILPKDELTHEKLNEIMVHVMPATLTLSSGKHLGEVERDKCRAKYLRDILSK